MLSITRRIGEAILVGSGWATRILVTSVRGGKVRIGIEAPREVTIMREELVVPREPKGEPR